MFLGIEGNQEKITFIQSSARSELTEFWLKDTFIWFKVIPPNREKGIKAQEAHTYQ